MPPPKFRKTNDDPVIDRVKGPDRRGPGAGGGLAAHRPNHDAEQSHGQASQCQRRPALHGD